MRRLVYLIIQSDKFFLIPLIISFISITAITGYLIIYYQQLPDKLPLLYSLPWGEAQLVTKQQFFLLPSVVALLSLTNAFLALQLKKDQLVLKRTLTMSLILINIVSLITAFKIYSIFT